MPDLKILVGDVREKLAEIAPKSIHCIVSSPPYWALRDYGTGSWEGGDATCKHETGGRKQVPQTISNSVDNPISGNRANRGGTNHCKKCKAIRVDAQIGSEPTVEEFYQTMVDVCRGLWKVLRDDGTLWLNMGDCYADSTPKQAFGDQGERWVGQGAHSGQRRALTGRMKAKDLVGQAWGLAFALRDAGWYLRSACVWSKPNPLPESVTDRPALSHEYVFMLTKSPTYFYDHVAVRSDYAASSLGQEGYQGEATKDYGSSGAQNPSDTKRRIAASMGKAWKATQLGPSKAAKNKEGEGGLWGQNTAHSDEERFGRNLRTVWTIPTQAFAGSHFATFPERLVDPCIRAGSSAAGCCRKCGTPWRRISSTEYSKGSPNMSAEKKAGASSDPKNRRSGQGLDENKRSVITTRGWEPSCAHRNVKEPVPCKVLDPFGGSGTTASVARYLGRDAVLIELNPKYAAMAEKRARARPKRLISAGDKELDPLDRALRIARRISGGKDEGAALARALLEHAGEREYE